MTENKPVLVTLVGTDGDGDELILSLPGTLEARESGWALCYTETDPDGFQTTANVVEAKADTVMITRTGGIESTILYKENTPFEGRYTTPVGMLYLCVLPSAVRARRRGDMGHIYLEYAVGMARDLKDASPSQHRSIDIRFRPTGRGGQ